MNPREKLGLELSSKLLEKGRQQDKKKEAQIQKILTPYAKQAPSALASVMISQISSKLLSRRQSSVRLPFGETPGPKLQPK
jgi:hypothetical protein